MRKIEIVVAWRRIDRLRSASCGLWFEYRFFSEWSEWMVERQESSVDVVEEGILRSMFASEECQMYDRVASEGRRSLTRRLLDDEGIQRGYHRLPFACISAPMVRYSKLAFRRICRQWFECFISPNLSPLVFYLAWRGLWKISLRFNFPFFPLSPPPFFSPRRITEKEEERKKRKKSCNFSCSSARRKYQREWSTLGVICGRTYSCLQGKKEKKKELSSYKPSAAESIKRVSYRGISGVWSKAYLPSCSDSISNDL